MTNIRRGAALGLLLLALTACMPRYNGAAQSICGTNTERPVRVDIARCENGDGVYRWFSAAPGELQASDDVPVGTEIPPVYLKAARP
jgi:hypothetical protein